ncbi:hypothetical protein ACFL2X_03710 [Candidatus Latescibacterota bacterium]
MNDVLEKASEDSFLRMKVRNMWIRKRILFAVIVVSVLCGNSDAWSDEFKLRDLKEASYPEVGLTTSGINLGYWHKRTGLRLSHYYLNKTRTEMILNLGYKLSDNEKTQKSINLLAGRFVGSDPGADYDYAYVGIAYGLNFSILGYRGFIIKLGMAKVLQDNLGNLADDPFVPCANIGYIYRFTPKEKK